MERCEYFKVCRGYSQDSFTCVKALDKNYCGMYKRFEKGGVDVIASVS